MLKKQYCSAAAALHLLCNNFFSKKTAEVLVNLKKTSNFAAFFKQTINQ